MEKITHPHWITLSASIFMTSTSLPHPNRTVDFLPLQSPQFNEAKGLLEGTQGASVRVTLRNLEYQVLCSCVQYCAPKMQNIIEALSIILIIFYWLKCKI